MSQDSAEGKSSERERERKFVVLNDQWKKYIRDEEPPKKGKVPPEPMTQGYVTKPGDTLVRVRLLRDHRTGKPKEAFFTMKSPGKIVDGANDRDEWNYPNPIAWAEAQLAEACHYSVEKTRHHISYHGRKWSVDEFTDPKYMGLTIAEVEFKKGENPKDLKDKDLPPFVNKASEVTEDKDKDKSNRFSTRSLADPANAKNTNRAVTKAKAMVLWETMKGEPDFADEKRARLAYKVLKAYIRTKLLPATEWPPSRFKEEKDTLYKYDKEKKCKEKDTIALIQGICEGADRQLKDLISSRDEELLFGRR